MILTNLTVSEEGQKHLIGDLKTKGLILDNLFSMFCYFLKNPMFDFISNIVANVTAMKEGREVVIEYAMMPKILDILRYDKVNAHRRKHLIEALRNVAFEYEGMEGKFLESGLVKEVAHVLSNEIGLLENIPEEIGQFKAFKAL